LEALAVRISVSTGVIAEQAGVEGECEQGTEVYERSENRDGKASDVFVRVVFNTPLSAGAENASLLGGIDDGDKGAAEPEAKGQAVPADAQADGYES
jgi:hypothetical protein